MYLNVNSKIAANFPHQKRSTKSKTQKFCEECFEGALTMASNNEGGIRSSKINMQTNVNLANDILDESDVEAVTNPWALKDATFPAKMQNYPLANPKIDLLIGEESKRKFNWNVSVTSPDAISEKEEMIREKYNQVLAESIMAETFDEKELEEKLKKLDTWKNYSSQDLREMRASQYLSYLWKQQDLKLKFNDGFADVLIKAEEIYHIDAINGEPIVRKCDPLNITIVRGGESPYIEDADIVIEESYHSIGQVIDDYYEDLTPRQVAILDKKGTGSGGSSNLIDYDNFNEPQNPINIKSVSDDFYETGTIDFDKITGTQGAYDEAGNVYVGKVTWRSLRKIGKLKWYDEDGAKQKKFVDENYVPDKELNEDVEWFWINEWWEATRIASDIYVKCQIRPIQFRRMGNRSAGGSGYVGTIYNVAGGKGKSLMDRMKPYQYMYNVFMYRTEMAFAKSKGKLGTIDLSMIPDGWEMDKWLYYAETMGWAVKDPFNEGNRGAATGKLAGNMNQNSTVIDLEMGNYIQQHIMMLQFIENQMGEIAGVSKQRQGQISNRETLGGVERAVTQSSHITEKWFLVHDNTKLRVLETLLETAKYCWRDKKGEKIQYISDDMTNIISEIDGETFNESEYGIMTSDSANDMELISIMKQLAQAGIQNDKLDFSTLIDIYQTDSISSMKRKIQNSEEDKIKRMQEEQQAQQQAQQQALQAQMQDKAEERKMKEQDSIRKAQTQIEVALIGKEDYDGLEDNMELERLKQSQEKIDNDYKNTKAKIDNDSENNKTKLANEDKNNQAKLKEANDKETKSNNIKKEALNETKRANREDEAIKRKQANKKAITN